MRIYIITLTLLVILAALAGCQGSQGTENRTVTTAATEIPRTPAPVTARQTIPETPQETRPTIIPPPLPTSGGPSFLSLGEVYRYGPPGFTIEASVPEYQYMDRYHWWDPTSGLFFPMLPAEGNRFLFIYVHLVNRGSAAQWIPSAEDISLCGVLPSGDSSCYTNLPYQNTTGYDDTALQELNDTYQWIQEVGVNERDYAYLRNSWYLASGHAGGFLWPGESNAIDGYLIYDVPRNLTAGNTTVNVWFNNQSRATWVLLNSPVPREQEPLAPDFFAFPESGPRPLTVQFTDKTAGEVASWSWDFGDGNASSLQNPLHTYTEPGSYSITLFVQNLHAANRTMKMNQVTVWPIASEFSSHSVVLMTSREGRITEGSYLHLIIPGTQSSITLNGSRVNLTPGADITLVFNREDHGAIGIRRKMVTNLSFEDLSLYVNNSFRARGAVQEFNLPSVELLPSALNLFIPASGGYTSLSWDDRVVLASEEHSRIFVNNTGIDVNGDLALRADPGRTLLNGNATAYRIPDSIIGGT
jgi:PKD repeat protein